ncbi:MAG: hypothetical protein CBB68_03390 [Rhodospirillaceae bacterium TMED8]|nr:hypothetical protein [Magnetovibrio sp.]OUT51932.1 MAG: hypothetical protein CBB68_03390 [Rhodospirillaceae bacterium TMED8]|tara:strand:- start:402 stop:1373 length:972 start_codon:yes stop_codon:yes gene_type:complete
MIPASSLDMLKKVREQYHEKVNVIPSHALNKDRLDVESTFLYHAGRTGGVAISTAFTAVYNCIASGARSLDKRLGFGRVETTEHGYGDEVHWLFIGTHAPYGFHVDFKPQPFQLLALARDPVTRIKSSYTKQCMRLGFPPDLESFTTFVRETTAHNAMTCQLCGFEPGMRVGQQHLEKALENLFVNFTAYCETSDSYRILDYYFSKFNLPNLIQDIPNRTLPTYDLEIDKLTEEILERNAVDFELFKWVSENPRVPSAKDLGEEISPHCVILYETEKERESAVKWGLFSTDLVMKVLSNEPELAENIEQLFKMCSAISDPSDE